MAGLRTVVVEDERLARRKLVMLLSTEPGVELVGETGNA
jgi:DNA-binding NarL/FixJ family response regulator